MKVYQTNEIKNIALLGSKGSGKTTLAEAMLYECGVIKRRGTVEAGNTVSDSFPVEKEYGYSVFTVTTMRDAAQEEFYFDMLAGLQLAGAICLYPPTRITKANALAKQIPVVSIGDKPEGCTFDSVELDGRKTGYLMGEYLVGLGHTHITFVSTPIKAKEISRLHRLEGLKAAFE